MSRDGIYSYGLIRQTDEGKVYFRFTEENLYMFCDGTYPLNEDILLMDFSAELGDTILLPYSEFENAKIEL